MFTAFWMLPTNRDYQYDSEIDIVENLAGKPDVIYQTYHYDNRESSYKVNDGDKQRQVPKGGLLGGLPYLWGGLTARSHRLLRRWRRVRTLHGRRPQSDRE